MNITVTGTVDEIIAFAESLKAVKKAQEPSKPIEGYVPHYEQKAQESEWTMEWFIPFYEQ
jgi:hypothetical protein